MAIYHLEAKIISRGAGRSACAASAYMSCSRIFNDYDGVQHDYTRKQGLVWERVFLPPMAPPEWQNREKLWNAVEAAEKTKDSRLAREFVAALPVELDRDVWIKLLSEFIQEQFVADGMCADVAIHDTDGHNPHAHIMLTVRPLTSAGKWQNKTEKEYLCFRDGEQRGFTAAEFRIAQNEGWEKQYPYKLGKKKVYLTPSFAETIGCERMSKYPKNTRYGRQNPISERWNSEDQLVAWRAAWADAVNRSLEQAGREERIDHRSHAERGIDEQPTIHEGVAARAMEKQGMIADRCELNRQIKEDNRRLRSIKTAVAKLIEEIKQTVPAIADALETIRQNMIVLRYVVLRNRDWRIAEERYQKSAKASYSDYQKLRRDIKEKLEQRKQMEQERDALPIISVFRRKDLTAKIEGLSEEIEELRNEETTIIRDFGKKDATEIKEVKTEISNSEAAAKEYRENEQKYSRELRVEKQRFIDIKAQANELDQAELVAARMAIRPEKNQEAHRRMKGAVSDGFSFPTQQQSILDVDHLLDEDFLELNYRVQQRYEQHNQQRGRKARPQEWER